MKKNLWISVAMTIVTTVLLGIIYPLVVTGLAQVIFPHKANGQLIVKDGKMIGSSIIGQGFSGPHTSTPVLLPRATVTMPPTRADRILARPTRSFLIVSRPT